MYALIDCNSFYAACERIFRPDLKHKPVVVLSNNDGCIIARSKEAKTLGIPMGAPFFEYQALLSKHDAAVFSSNYALYGDISSRVMSIISSFEERMECYSIDEAFIEFDHMPSQKMKAYFIALKKRIQQCTGIPVSIGIGPTKTLAKAANYWAKKQTQYGIAAFITYKTRQTCLRKMSVSNIWGIGSQLAKRLNALNIFTAWDFAQASSPLLQEHFSILVQTTQRELLGEPCLKLEDTVESRKSIASSKSFGKDQKTLPALQEVLAVYTSNAAQKLRNQNSLTDSLLVSVVIRKPNSFKTYTHQCTVSIPQRTQDTTKLIAYATKGLEALFEEGKSYKKVGIVLTNLVPNTFKQLSLLNPVVNDESFKKEERAKKRSVALDSVNDRFGRDTLYIAKAQHPHLRHWRRKANFESPHYTTSWSELKQLDC